MLVRSPMTRKAEAAEPEEGEEDMEREDAKWSRRIARAKIRRPPGLEAAEAEGGPPAEAGGARPFTA